MTSPPNSPKSRRRPNSASASANPSFPRIVVLDLKVRNLIWPPGVRYSPPENASQEKLEFVEGASGMKTAEVMRMLLKGKVDLVYPAELAAASFVGSGWFGDVIRLNGNKHRHIDVPRLEGNPGLVYASTLALGSFRTAEEADSIYNLGKHYALKLLSEPMIGRGRMYEAIVGADFLFGNVAEFKLGGKGLNTYSKYLHCSEQQRARKEVAIRSPEAVDFAKYSIGMFEKRRATAKSLYEKSSQEEEPVLVRDLIESEWRKIGKAMKLINSALNRGNPGTAAALTKQILPLSNLFSAISTMECPRIEEELKAFVPPLKASSIVVTDPPTGQYAVAARYDDQWHCHSGTWRKATCDPGMWTQMSDSSWKHTKDCLGAAWAGDAFVGGFLAALKGAPPANEEALTKAIAWAKHAAKFMARQTTFTVEDLAPPSAARSV